MDVAPVSAPPVTIPSRSSAGAAQPVQTVSAVAGAISPSATNIPDTPPANSGNPASGDTPSSDTLAKAVKLVNESFAQKGQNLYAAFEKDRITGINVIKFVDKKTNETISQIPLKEMVALAQSLEQPQGARGKLFHTTA